MRQQECKDYQSSLYHAETQHGGTQMDLVGDHVERTSYVLTEAFASQQNLRYDKLLLVQRQRSTLDTIKSSEPSERTNSFNTAQDSDKNIGHNMSFAELGILDDDLPEDDAEMERLFNEKFGCDSIWVEENKKVNKKQVADISGVAGFFGKLFA